MPPAHGSLSGMAPALSYTPQADYAGPDEFLFKANDGTLDSNVATVNLTITPVNDAPVLAPIGDQTVAEGALLSVTVSASDVDGDKLSYQKK